MSNMLNCTEQVQIQKYEIQALKTPKTCLLYECVKKIIGLWLLEISCAELNHIQISGHR